MTLRTHLGGRVFAEHQTGRPPGILALHGWGRDRTDLLPALRGRDVTALDLPGFGSSPPPPSVWGAAEYATAVAEVVQEAGSGPLLVVAHSFGGRVAAHLAADHPLTVSGVVFVGVPLLRRQSGTGGRRAPLPYRLVRKARSLGLVSEDRLEATRRRYGSADYNAATGVMRDVLVKTVNEDYRSELIRITCPVAFCWGEHDTAAPPAIAAESAGVVSNAVTVEVIEGAGHDVHKSAPEQLGRVIDAVAGAIG